MKIAHYIIDKPSYIGELDENKPPPQTNEEVKKILPLIRNEPVRPLAETQYAAVYLFDDGSICVFVNDKSLPKDLHHIFNGK